MITEIIKRDGRKVPFTVDKISQAIMKAFIACRVFCDHENCQLITNSACQYLEHTVKGTPTVEQVQDAVERALIAAEEATAAKAYILYRAERTRTRELDSRIMRTLEEITFSDSKDSDVKRENANINGDTPMGTMLKYGSESAKQFYKLRVLNPKHSAAHENGDIHIHDLDFLTLTTTCCQIDLSNLFKNGFSTGHGFLREPQDIMSYSALACIAIQSNQNDQHGGQSIPNLDYALAEGVKKTYKKRYKDHLVRFLEAFNEPKGFAFDPLWYKEAVVKCHQELKPKGFAPALKNGLDFFIAEKVVLAKNDNLSNEAIQKAQGLAVRHATKDTNRTTYQAMEAFVHNLNTMHSRAGAQVPFSSINYGTDTSPEGRLVTRNMLLALESGLGNGETPIFPIHIFKVKEGVNYNQGDPNYDLLELACKVSAKRLFPNFAFIDAPFNLQYYKAGRPETEVAYMGCRTRVIGNAADTEREITFGRGNLSFTSINLPRLAIEAKGDKKKFFMELGDAVNLCIEQLNERFEIQASKKVFNYPFLMGQGVWMDSEKLKPNDEVREVLKHGTLSVGFIGLAEALTALIGEHHGESNEAQELGFSIVEFMRKKLDCESYDRSMNYTLIATPAEGLSGRFVNIDKKKYGVIKGVTDKEFYTNSFHVPVDFNITAFKKIQTEATYHALTNAGHISYVEADGDISKNLPAMMSLVRCMKESGIGYGAINHPVDRDLICGYTGVINDVCPKCGRVEGDTKFERIRRITGYLVGTVERFNNAKQAEEKARVKHGLV